MIRLIGRLILVIAMLLGMEGLVYAQLAFGGNPLETTQATHEVEVIPPFNPQDLRSAHHWREVDDGSPLIVGQMIPLKEDFYTCATHEIVAGRSVYSLQISAPEARALSLSFERMALNKGDRLYLFDPARRQVLGSFTYESNPDGGIFGTNPIAGSVVVIQYEPAGTLADIRLKQLGYYFEAVAAPKNIPGEGASGVCNVNVNCSEGADMQDVKNGIVQILAVIDGSIGSCSGTLVNNTNQDWRPLIMTAYHCTFAKSALTGSTVHTSEEDFRQWVFNFHYERPECADNHWVGDDVYSISGAKRLAYVPMERGSDGLLIETLQPIPDYYGVYYNGWDRSGTLEPSAKGLHHPHGDVMKVSTITETLVSDTWMTADNVGAKDAHFAVRYAKTEHGHCVTEGGSSGSGLFNANGLLIGTLSGGAAECDKGINAKNMYGKLSEHWIRSEYNEEDRVYPLAEILDPKGNGTAMTLQGAYKPNAVLLHPVNKLQGSYKDGQVHLRWEPLSLLASGVTVQVQILRDGKEIHRQSISEASYTDSHPTSEGGIVTYTVRYEFQVGATETKYYTAPRHISFITADLAGVSQLDTHRQGEQITLTWDKPINRQIISQLSLTSESEAKAVASLAYPGLNRDYQEVYLGVRYDGLDFVPLGHTRLVAMHFIPARSPRMYDYTLFVRNGQNVSVISSGADRDCYEIVADDATTTVQYPVGDKFKEKTWYWVYGFTPKLLRGDEMLIVGYKIKTRTDFTRDVAMIDTTPVTDRSSRHNVLSFDTHYWMPADIEGSLPISGGALAIEFMIDDATVGTPVDVTGKIARGFYPAQWPIVKEYVIYADGREIGRTKELTYTISNATSQEYTVKPLYEDGRISAVATPTMIDEAIRVYPTVCTDRLTILANGCMGTYTIYTLQGDLIREGRLGDSLGSCIDTAGWLSGSYILNVTLADGSTTMYRIVKK